MDESVQKHLTELDEVSRLLLKAASYIEEHGWCQGEAEDARGRVCIAGAIYRVTGCTEFHVMEPHPHRGGMFTRVRDSIESQSDTRIPDWNDTKGRTQAEVVAKLRAVALGG